VLAAYFIARFDSSVSHQALFLPQPDPLTLELNCIVQGDEPTHVFPIKIACTESIGSLKKVIKEENPEAFQNVDACSIGLWQVSIQSTTVSEKTCKRRTLQIKEYSPRSRD
jgi:hypothetical protein